MLHTLILVSLGVFTVSLLAGLVLVAVRALALWRSLRHLRRAITRELGRLTARVGQSEQELARALEGLAELERARARLQASLATASVLARSAGEAWALVTRLRALRALLAIR